MFGLKASHYRASAIFGICTALNIFSAFELIGLRLKANVIGVIIFLWVLIVMFIFSKNDLHKKILSQFENDEYYTKILGIIVVLIYILTSLFIFFKLKIQ